MSKDYYKLLKLNSSATKEEIKLSYRRLAQKYHPDKTATNRFENKFKEINDAYRILADESKRKNYDQQLQFQDYSKTTNSSLILIYMLVLIVVATWVLWYLSHFSLSSF